MIKKGTKVICHKCDAHVTTFARAVDGKEQIIFEMFDQKVGQGPWKTGEHMACRKCQANWMLVIWRLLKESLK